MDFWERAVLHFDAASQDFGRNFGSFRSAALPISDFFRYGMPQSDVAVPCEVDAVRFGSFCIKGSVQKFCGEAFAKLLIFRREMMGKEDACFHSVFGTDIRSGRGKADGRGGEQEDSRRNAACAAFRNG